MSGAGILTEGMSTVDRLRSFCDAYDDAGGTGSKVLIRRVWVGEPKAELVARQRAVYQGYSSGGHLSAADQTLSASDPAELAERLHATCVAAGADAVNLRVHLPGITPSEARRQITLLAEGVVPRLVRMLAPGARS